jgi:hypothetical protein
VPYAGGRFSEGLAPVSVNGKTGYIDRTGTLVIPALPYRGLDFSDGMAKVYVDKPCGSSNDKQNYGFIDRAGKLVIPFKLTHPCNYYGDQFYFKKEGLALTQIGEQWGFVDKSGKVVLKFYNAGPFSEGLAHVQVGGRFGYIDPAGKMIIQPQFEAALPFTEGLAPVKIKGLWGFIDKRGKVIVPPRFQGALGFSEGMAAIQIGEYWGYIDHDGKVAIEPRPDMYCACPFSNGRAQAQNDREIGFIDKSGKFAIEPDYHLVDNFRDGLAFVAGDETGRAYIDVNGKVVYKFPERQGPLPDPKNPFVRINNSKDVAWLERIATSPVAAAELRPGGGLANSPKDLSTAAYIRLGNLGTPESVAALKRIEERAHLITPLSDRSTPGDFIHPGWHFSDSELHPIAQVKSPNGTTYALIVSSLMGDLDLFLISSKTPEDPAAWTRPLLVPNSFYRGIKEPKLSLNGSDELIFSFTQEAPPPRSLMEGTHDPGPKAPAMGIQQWKLSIKAIAKDSDKDGWTDVEEQRLGLDPTNKDTDGDGIPDGQDVCPNYSLRDEVGTDEEVRIFQKAFFATFGLGGSRHLLLVGADSRRVHVWGYAGPVIYGQDVKSWSRNHQYGAVYVSWRIRKRISETEVIVEIVDYEGPLAAGGQDVHLRKIRDEWVVISRRTTWVS